MLRALIDVYLAEHNIEHDAEFARRAGVQGGKAMLHQHLKTLKPISVEAAKNYARELRCPIRQFSPRIADLVDTSHLEQQRIYRVESPTISEYYPREPNKRESIIQEIEKIARGLDDISLGELLGRAKSLATDDTKNKTEVNHGHS